MLTLEEIKKGLECCGQFTTLAYIQQLESKLNQAVEDIRMLGRMGQNVCPVCAHYNHGEGDKQKCVGCIMKWDTDNFEWRGRKDEQEA